MAISTFFGDSKISQYTGSMMLALPILVFLWLSGKGSNALYLFYWLPLFPASTITGKLVSMDEDLYQTYGKEMEFRTDDNYLVVLEMMDYSSIFAWLMLITLPVFWFYVYLYLEQVVPNEFGIAKDPLFFLKHPGRRISNERIQEDVESKEFSPNDPI